MGIAMGPGDVVFRMNLVSLKDEGGATLMNDFTSGHITSEEAARIVADLREQLARDGIEFFNGVSYRHLMMWRGGPRTTKLTPPHDITGQSIEGQLPEGEGAERLSALMKKSQEILRNHPVNLARREAGKTEATSAWFWGQGTRPAVPTLKERFGLEGSVISAVDLVNGVGPSGRTRSHHGAGRDRISRYRLCRERSLRPQVAGAQGLPAAAHRGAR